MAIKCIEYPRGSVSNKLFPKIMTTTIRATSDHTRKVAVLFTRSKEGTVVRAGEIKNRGSFSMGFYSSSWSPEEFEDYNNGILLENE